MTRCTGISSDTSLVLVVRWQRCEALGLTTSNGLICQLWSHFLDVLSFAVAQEDRISCLRS